MNTTPLSAVTEIPSTDSEVPYVLEKKRASLVIPPPPISEEKRPSEDKPLIQCDRPSSPAAYEKGEHQYSNLPSPCPEPKSPSDTHLMPPIAEANEQSNSNRPGLRRRESCDSITLDPNGYITFIASEGERLSEDQPESPASDTNMLPDGPSSSAVLNSPVHEPRDPSDDSLIPRTAEATEQCVSSRPDELQPSRKPSVISVQWPSPSDEIRARFKPPALPPARKPSTTSTQIIPRCVSYPTSYPEKRSEIESSGYPQPRLSQIRRTSGAAMNTTPLSAVTEIPSTDSEVPYVLEKKRASLVIPPPPISEEKRPSEDKPLIQCDRPSSPAAYEKGEHQYSNLPSPCPEPKSPSDTHLMPPIAEANEQSNSNRPGLRRRESCDSITLDPNGYITFIASEGERLSEDQPESPASDTNMLPDGPSSSAVLNSPVHEPRDPSDDSLIPRTAEATEQCVSSRPGLSQRESCDSVALDPQGYVKCIS
ncbi:histone-lysine N-methyltransferase 2D-like [Orbicella faveolata]|uniref:histone-lysine N-methyltransferase 2D-like n=1 Tax=Orbicella faveolata TaxID=48498 RepID=UPI0009E439F1|nr:histone-lysine N-methyltransferase 2D-like [Orbicella faveolata]